MAFCGACGNKMEDDSVFCPKCGAPVEGAQAATPNQQPVNQQQPMPDQGYASQQGYVPPQGTANTRDFTVDMGTDYTSTFTPSDISDYKVFALVAYLFAPIGIVVTLLAGLNSPFAMFHAREAAKIFVAETLMWLIAIILFFLVIPLLIALIGSFVLGIVNIICIVRAGKGQAKLAPIVGGMKLFR